MSDERAAKALEERYKSQPNQTPSHHYYRRGFMDGYSAASAECEALVREAVQATIEEAAQVTVGTAQGIRLYEARAERIRALDPEPIIRRVMASKETANVTEQ